MRAILQVYVPAIVLIVIGFVVALHFVTPPPPKELRLATGQAGGYYDAAGRIYREILGRESINVVLVETQGSIDNLQRLTSDRDRVDVALIQGGLSSDRDTSRLFAIAGVFYEPVWVLARTAVHAQRLAELRGAKIAIGAVGSGTRILARQLLAANGVTERSAEFAELGTAAAVTALAQDTVDTAFIVVARPLPAMVDLLVSDKARLLSFSQADALQMKFAFLTPVRLPMGAVDLEANVPSADLRLVAPTAALVAREDIHPAFVTLLLQAAHEAHSGPQFFAPAGMFPTRNHLDFSLHPDAKRYFERGPSFLFRYLPFWIAVWMDRMVVLLIPLLTLLIPIVRLAPPVYRWQVQRRIYRWYAQLRQLEAEAQTAPDAARLAEIRAELDTLQVRLATLKVPSSSTQQLYHLRLHLDFVRARVD